MIDGLATEVAYVKSTTGAQISQLDIFFGTNLDPKTHPPFCHMDETQ